jgi:hypothetical protein
MSECNSTLLTSNTAAQNVSQGDKPVIIRTWKRSVSRLNIRNNLISDKKMVSQSNSDLLSNRNKFAGNSTVLLERVGLRAAGDLDNTSGQFDRINRTAWNHYDAGNVTNGTLVNVISVNTHVNAGTKGNSVVSTKSDVNVISDDISAKNVLVLRNHQLTVPNNNTYSSGNVWKSLTGQGKTFSRVYSVTGRSEIQDRASLNSATNVEDTSSILVQKRGKRATEVENVGSTITTTTDDHIGHPDAHIQDASNSAEYEQCLTPEYIVYTWVLCLVALATALKLYYLMKTTLATVMVSVFTTLILVAYKDVFDKA